MKLADNMTTLEQAEQLAVQSNRLVYAANTCWWKISLIFLTRPGAPASFTGNERNQNECIG